MAIKRFARTFLLLLMLVPGWFSQLAAQIPPRPEPPRLVNDLAGVFNEEERSNLERMLVLFSDSTSNQIVVITVPDLNGYDKAAFAYEVGEKWGVGNAKFDNGIVVLYKPKTSSSKGEIFIATGYGLEGAIPDATSRRIVEQEMIPRFKQNDTYGGIVAGVNVLMSLAKGEYNSAQYAKKKNNNKGWGVIVPIIIIVIVILLFKSNRGNHQAIGKDIPFWTLLMLLSSQGGRHGGSFGDFKSGSGGFGGGGGFGGFGGGSFGGGGAGGSW